MESKQLIIGPEACGRVELEGDVAPANAGSLSVAVGPAPVTSGMLRQVAKGLGILRDRLPNAAWADGLSVTLGAATPQVLERVADFLDAAGKTVRDAAETEAENARLRAALLDAAEAVEQAADVLEDDDLDGECAEMREEAQEWRELAGAEREVLRLWLVGHARLLLNDETVIDVARQVGVALASSARNATVFWSLYSPERGDFTAVEVTSDPFAFVPNYDAGCGAKGTLTVRSLAEWIEHIKHDGQQSGIVGIWKE